MAQEASQRSQAASNLQSTNIISGRRAEIGGALQFAIATSASQDASKQVQLANATSSQIMTQIAGLDKGLMTAAKKIKNADLSGIIDVIWKEFQAMSKLQKFLVLLAAGVVVGAASYYCWKRMGGNWEMIKKVTNEVMVDLNTQAEELLEKLDMNTVLNQLQGIIVNRVQNPSTVDSESIKKLMDVVCTLGYGGLVSFIITEMQK